MVQSLFSFSGKSVLVVGGASGIGASYVSLVSSLGARVVVLDIVPPPSGAAEFVPFDIERDSLEAHLAAREPVRAAVVTPGYNLRKPLNETSDSDFRRILEVNAVAYRRLLCHLCESMSREGDGAIAVVSSVRATSLELGQGLYSAAKAALNQLVRAFACEYGPKGVRINAVAPGLVQTEFSKPVWEDSAWHKAIVEKTCLRRIASPLEIASALAFLTCSASSYVTGCILPVDAGWTVIDGRFAPPI